jgi:hypothetical protein
MTDQPEPSSPEFQLRFPALKGKDKPTGYIHLDEALDRLGKKRLPDRYCGSRLDARTVALCEAGPG